MDAERPKSSALTIKRRASEAAVTGPERSTGALERCCTPSGSRAIVGRNGAGYQSPPGPEDEKDFLPLVQARQFGAEDRELLPFQFSQQPPINRAHQFRSNHRAAIHRRQSFARQPVKIPRSVA